MVAQKKQLVLELIAMHFAENMNVETTFKEKGPGH